jgi:hypothetical protein
MADRMKIVEDRMKEQLQKIEHLTRENHGMRQQIKLHRDFHIFTMKLQ